MVIQNALAALSLAASVLPLAATAAQYRCHDTKVCVSLGDLVPVHCESRGHPFGLDFGAAGEPVVISHFPDQPGRTEQEAFIGIGADPSSLARGYRPDGDTAALKTLVLFRDLSIVVVAVDNPLLGAAADGTKFEPRVVTLQGRCEGPPK